MNVDPAAILALISDLYTQMQEAQNRVAELEAQLEKEREAYNASRETS